MTKYNLTDKQKQLIREIIALIKSGELDEEFEIFWYEGYGMEPSAILSSSRKPGKELPNATKGGIIALENSDLLYCQGNPSRPTCIITAEAYVAVETNFEAPDNSFIKHLTPLADISELDEELKRRCLPLLAAGGSDPKLWDSAVRAAGVILEERLRDVGGVPNPTLTGRSIVNSIFTKDGTLASKFNAESERESYRELYAGIFGAFRNPSAHRLIDPSPEDGGALIIFINLLLKKLEALR